MSDFDVVIAGGGPAGLNAALILGRVGRPVLLADDGRPRNAPSAAVHGFLSRDGTDPAEIRQAARGELARYPSVHTRDTTVRNAAPADGGFEVTTADGATVRARRLLLATGVSDELPPIDGLDRLWGRGLYHCPYCHGWEARGQEVAVLGGDDRAAHLALDLTRLGCDVIMCANGPVRASDAARAALAARQIRICEDPVSRAGGEPGRPIRLHLASGRTLERRAVFIPPQPRQRSDLAQRLGCTLLDDGAVQVNELGQTTVPGVYAAGDMCRTPAMPYPAAQVIMAAAQGARAAVVIDQELLFTDAYPASSQAGEPSPAAPGPPPAQAR
jgi:thioredoxin reductase